MQRRPSGVPHHRACGPGGSSPGRGRARVCPGDRAWWAPSPRPPRAVSHSHSHQQALGTECPRSGEGGRQGDSGGLWRSGHKGVGRTFWNLHFTFSFIPCDFRLCTCVRFRKHVGVRAPHPLPNGQTRAGQRAQHQKWGSPCTPTPSCCRGGARPPPPAAAFVFTPSKQKEGRVPEQGSARDDPRGGGGGGGGSSGIAKGFETRHALATRA